MPTPWRPGTAQGVRGLTSAGSKHVNLALSGSAVQQATHLAGTQVVAQLGAKGGDCTATQQFKLCGSRVPLLGDQYIVFTITACGRAVLQV